MIAAITKASIFKKVAAISVSILLTAAIVVNIAVGFIKQNMENELSAFGNKILDFYSKGLETQVRSLEEYSFTMMQLSGFQEPLKKIAGHEGNQSSLEASIALSAAIRNDPINMTAIRGLLISDARGTVHSSSTVQFERYISNNLIELAVQGQGSPVWVSIPGADREIALCRAIRTVRNDFQYWDIGVMVLIVDLDELLDSELLQSNFYEGKLTVADAKGEILYIGSDHAAATLKIGDILNEEALRTDEDILLSHEVGNTSWNLYFAIPKNNIFSNINMIINTQYLFFALLFFVAIALSVFFSSKVTYPLRRLRQEMFKVSTGDFSLDADYLLMKSGKDEVGQICRSFVETTQTLESLINENYKVQIAQKDAQIKALQAQIDPHFIYNTLDTVNWLAKMNKQDTIASTVQALSRLLRNAMKIDVAKSRLNEELALVRDYIQIQQLRYGSRLVYQEAVDEAALQIKLPRLILQPIVENSIKHCVEVTDAVCEIKLLVETIGSGLTRVSISDNGPGNKMLGNDSAGLQQIQKNGNGIGLQNVERRLVLLYGKNTAFTLRNIVPHGFEVEFVIPDDKEENTDDDSNAGR